MKSFLLLVAIGLALAGCGEKKQAPAPNASALMPSPPLKAPDFIKASTERPAAIPEKLDSTAGCQVDWVNDQLAQKPVSITDKAKVRFGGWAADTVKGTVSHEVFVALYGPAKIYFKASPGLKRLDVAAAYKKTGMENSGWEAYADLSGAAAGTYYVQVIQLEGTSGSVCDTQRTIVIKK